MTNCCRGAADLRTWPVPSTHFGWKRLSAKSIMAWPEVIQAWNIEGVLYIIHNKRVKSLFSFQYVPVNVIIHISQVIWLNWSYWEMSSHFLLGLSKKPPLLIFTYEKGCKMNCLKCFCNKFISHCPNKIYKVFLHVCINLKKIKNVGDYQNFIMKQ